MPWHIERDNPECSGYAVVKDADGSVAGCHETEEAAAAQVAALYASELTAEAVAPPVEDATLTLGAHRTLDLDEPLTELSIKERRLGLRLLTYGQVVESKYGPIMFERGAFGIVDPKQIRLRMDHADPPTGLGHSFTDMPDAPHMDFIVSKTPRGDEQLTLAVDGVSRGASVGFDDIKGRPKVRQMGGRNVTVYGPDSARLGEVSTTWQPTFAGDAVTYMLHQEQKGSGPMAEAQEAPTNGAIDYEKLTGAIVAANASTAHEGKLDAILSKFDGLMELQRSQIIVPNGEARRPLFKDWFGVTLRRLAGDTITTTELKTLALDDVVTTEQPGLVPSVFTPDYNDIIRTNRPFLETTREVRPPATGNAMTLPLITGRAVAGSQAGNAEKGALTTTAPKVGTGTFTAKSIFAGADISVQMILRADRSFLDLLDQEFFEAYALDEESKAITALLTGYTDSASVSHQVTDGGVLDPETPSFGTAFLNAVTSTARRRPTHIWLSATAVAAFIDAKAPLTNAPLYSNLAAAFTAGGGPGGTLSGLSPVYVPALDDSEVDVIVGPSSGFVWAEDPAIRLQADNPSVAGRDIVLAGTLFPAPRYADAFTTYTVGS